MGINILCMTLFVMLIKVREYKARRAIDVYAACLR